MILGVAVKKLPVFPDERGRLMVLLRNDDEIFIEFGQVYVTTAYPGVVKAWHFHRHQTDNMTVIRGMMKIVLYDDRVKSPTYREINEFFSGVHNPMLLRIPNGIYHGFKCISEEEAMVVNIPTKVYNHDDPDDHRISPHPKIGMGIPYDWGRKDG